jgi:hypothetical protein
MNFAGIVISCSPHNIIGLLNPHIASGGGVNLPTDRPFQWHFRTVWNKVKRFGDVSKIWLGYKSPGKLLSYVAPEIQYGGWKHEYAIEIFGRFTKPCRNATRHRILMRFSTVLMTRH